MKKIYSIITSALLVSMALNSNAQIISSNNGAGFDQLIKSSPADATKLVYAYAEPLFKGFAEGLNSGWNNTAKTKKFLHFDLRFTGNLALVPVSDQTFDVTKIGLSNHITPADPTKTISPTFAGTDTKGPVLNINNDAGTKVSSFTLPAGLIHSIVPAPNLQLTIGIFSNTDLTIRTTPTISFGSDAGSVGVIGFGLKHDIIQDFAGKLPKPFDLAIAVNYNRINYTNKLNIQPDGGTTAAPGQSSDFSNQRIDSHFTGLNVQAIISKKIAFFTPFFSLGYETATSNFGVLGNYPISSSSPTQPNMYVTVSNPVNISETTLSDMRADIGFQLSLGVLRVYASYSVGQYSSVNGGLGLGF